MTEKATATLPGRVEKIIKPMFSSEPEKAPLTVALPMDELAVKPELSAGRLVVVTGTPESRRLFVNEPAEKQLTR